MSPYWQAQLEPMQRGMNTLGSAMIMAPRIRQQVALMQARQAEEEQMAQEAAARTALLGTQNQRGQLQLSQALALANRFKQPGAITSDKDGNLVIDKGAIADVTSALAGMGKDANDSSLALGNIFKAANAPVQANLERTNKANISAASDAERANRPVTVPSGGTLMSPTGDLLGSGGVTLNPGQTRFAPVGSDDLDTSGQLSLADGLKQIAAGAPKQTPEGLPPLVQAEAFKSLLNNEGGGTNTMTALQGLRKANAAASAPAANPATPGPATNAIPTINSQDDYDALPAGSSYKDSNGRLAVKRGK